MRRTELETIILQASSELKKLESQTPTDPSGDEDPRLSRAKRWDHATTIALAREQLRTLQQEQKTYAAEAELLPARLELSKRDATAKELVAQQLSAAVAQRRDTKVTAALATYRDQFGQPSGDPVVGILAMEERWLEIVRESAQLQQTNVDARSAADAMQKDFLDRKADVEKDMKSGGEIRSALGLKLQRLRSKLPTLGTLRRKIADVQREIDSAQVLQSQIESRIEELDGGTGACGRARRCHHRIPNGRSSRTR